MKFHYVRISNRKIHEKSHWSKRKKKKRRSLVIVIERQMQGFQRESQSCVR